VKAKAEAGVAVAATAMEGPALDESEKTLLYSDE